MSGDIPQIHTGFWIDWSRDNAILGSTLTYDTRWGSQLVSGATVLVQLTGGALWTLVAFWLHQRAVSVHLYDEFEAQKQVILRNSSTAAGAILALWNLASTWHGHARRAWSRALAYMLMPAVIFVGFAVAGVLVGHITVGSSNSHVLLAPGLCGFVNQTDASMAAQVHFKQMTSLIADAYARNCYSGSYGDLVSCSSFAKPRLAYRRARNVACPIGPGMCASNDSAAVSFQALDLDSHVDLGINAKSENRLRVSYNATCAPVSQSLLDTLTILDNTTGLRDQDRVYPTLFLKLGQERGQADSFPFNYSTAMRYYGFGNARYTVAPYRSWSPHISLNPLNTFAAGAPFNKMNTDLSLFVVAQNQIAYSQPSQDPVFRTYANPSPGGYYRTDHDISVIACAEQYRVCKSMGNCTAWSPLLPLYLSGVAALSLNPDQNATWTRLSATFVFANMFFAASTSSPLRAADLVMSDSISVGLSDHQWMREVEAWFQGTLAQIQYLTSTYTQRPDALVTANSLSIIQPDTPAGIAQCAQQLIQIPPGYASYSLLALVVVALVAVITISLGLCLSSYGHKLPGRRPGQKNHAKLLAFQGDGMLQLHRMAVEAAGYDGWQGGTGHKKDVPFVDRASARLPPPTILAEPESDADSMTNGLLGYEKSNKSGRGKRRVRDSLSWIKLHAVPGQGASFRHFSLKNTSKDEDVKETVDTIK